VLFSVVLSFYYTILFVFGNGLFGFWPSFLKDFSVSLVSQKVSVVLFFYYTKGFGLVHIRSAFLAKILRNSSLVKKV